jgi:hypothetical protein
MPDAMFLRPLHVDGIEVRFEQTDGALSVVVALDGREAKRAVSRSAATAYYLRTETPEAAIVAATVAQLRGQLSHPG